MQLNVSVVELSDNQKKLQVQIPAQRVQKELDVRYRDLAKRARIKGFRPGKVPRSILKSYYGKSVENEVSHQFIQETFPAALRQAELKPLVEADIDEIHFGDDGALSYSATIEVSPPFEVEGYKGLEIKKPSTEVSEENIQAELENLREQHGELHSLENDRPVQPGDVVVVDFDPWCEGTLFEKGKTTDYMLEVGKKTLHPDFDDQMIGRKKGEFVSFELDYPEDAPTPEIAGKRVRFEVTIKDVKEKRLPELDDDFAQTLGDYDTLEELKAEIRRRLQEAQQKKVSAEVQQQIVDQLVNRVEIALSDKVIEREVDRLIGFLQRQFESQGLQFDAARFNTPEIRAEYRPQAERNVRWRLICDRIAELENIELTEEELDEIYSQIGRLLRIDSNTVRNDYAESSIVQESKEKKIEEKVLKLLEDESITV